LFRDIQYGDFRLSENSPAFKIGFKDIDMTRIGLTDKFPDEYRNIVRKQLGNNYDEFKFLEKKCSIKNGGKGNFNPTEGI
jgi:hypothetical protein